MVGDQSVLVLISIEREDREIALLYQGYLRVGSHGPFCFPIQQTITLKMADKRRSDICVVFTMSLCALE